MVNRKSKVALLPLALILGVAWTDASSNTSIKTNPQVDLSQAGIEAPAQVIASAETTLFGWETSLLNIGSEPPTTEKSGGIGVETPEQAINTVEQSSISNSENQAVLGAEGKPIAETPVTSNENLPPNVETNPNTASSTEPVQSVMPVTHEVVKTTTETKAVSANASPIVGLKEAGNDKAPIAQSADAAPDESNSN